MSGFLNVIIEQMERSTAGSGDTAKRVLQMCKGVKPKNALFLGDDVFSPRLIAETGAEVLATFGEKKRAETAKAAGLNARQVGAYEITKKDGGWDFIWYNGITEPDGVMRRLEQIHEGLKPGGTAVFRTLCWLIDPSPDTKSYVERRFGRPIPLDEVLREAKDEKFSVEDFYIAPKSDWKRNFYEPMSELVRRLEGLDEDDGEQASGIGEINKEIYMFDLHSEEYSFVYYILKGK